ncbi:hypothetical protein DFH07DRAFT_765302 [Mycena maculata]|uniref:Uncharacterized protein n=1 Tax=Mycena maculata TaxID=230809 RepID=A0AAD7K8V5_9AGAR|nr:hypothetical protein DFH07DRAFT_765302 [Mycena maculata]
MTTGYPSAAWCGHQSVEGCIQEWQQHCALGVHPHPAAPAAQTTRSVMSSSEHSASHSALTARSDSASTRSGSLAVSPGTRGTSTAVAHSPSVVVGSERAAVSTPAGTQTPRTDTGRPVKGKLQEDLKRFCMPNLPSRHVAGSSSSRNEDRSLGSVSSMSSVTASAMDPVLRPARYYAIWGGGKVFADREEARAAFRREEERGATAQMLSTKRHAEAEPYSQGAIWI